MQCSIMVALQIPLAGMGLLTFLLNFIPNFGFVVAVILPFIILTSMKSHQMVLSCFAYRYTYRQYSQPGFFYKNKDIQLHPLTSLLCVIVWVMIWGVPAAFWLSVDNYAPGVFEYVSPSLPDGMMADLSMHSRCAQTFCRFRKSRDKDILQRMAGRKPFSSRSCRICLTGDKI